MLKDRIENLLCDTDTNTHGAKFVAKRNADKIMAEIPEITPNEIKKFNRLSIKDEKRGISDPSEEFCIKFARAINERIRE